ncbi:preprotein translocase subunit SecA [Christensenellaceae bacterium OttesenSCG-928-L17]|nr:preprotein translocase subunit SecA [Christensenellaceae bacterium OttesenSCG-928-L17]
MAKKEEMKKAKKGKQPKAAASPAPSTKAPKPRKEKKEKKPTDKLADKTALTKFLQGVFGDAQKKILRRLYKRTIEINKLAPKYEAMTKKELSEQTAILKEKLDKLTKKEQASLVKKKLADQPKSTKKADKKSAKTEIIATPLVNYTTEEKKSQEKVLNTILPEAFALAREACARILKMRPFDVQLIGGMALHEGNVAEMKTGEGKTLVAVLPAYLNALTGKGVHIVTVNDYLAQRDAGWNGPVYDFLGLSVGVIINDASFVYDPEYENNDHDDERFRHLRPSTRKEAYAADVTYGTNNEFGFDYLRDNMVKEVEFLRQRELNFAIVDEVDSILIDEARTPLIISAPAADNPESYYQFAKIAAQLSDEDYILDEKRRSVSLTDEGVDKVQRLLGIKNLYSVDNTRLVYHMDQALRAQVVFRRDKDYVVTNSGEVIIVDEHTGRLMQGRRYNEGLHQAIEAKEGVAVKEESQTLATVSFQNFFRLYKKLSGMTGTAFTEAEEFQQIYALDVIQIPPNKPIIRLDKDDLIYRTEAAKLKAVATEIKKYHDKGQPVLVGSASIVKNELIANYLDKEGIKYEILNAKNNEREAAIIAKAGEKGAVTLATNMAGRGTDIKLAPGVRELGGLVVIGSERHDSRRVDNQLRGRGGRQGDPGTTQFFVSCEDDLMRIFQGDRIANLMKRMGVAEDLPIQNKTVSKTLESAQKRVEGFNFDSRKNVVQYDNVINRHRRVVYLMRRKILMGEDIRVEIGHLMEDAVTDLTLFSSRVNKKFVSEFRALFSLDEDLVESIGLMRKAEDRKKLALVAVEEAYSDKEMQFSEEVMRKIEREVYLQVLDMLWMQHLENMQHLREGIHWRSVGQRDPLVEYRSESQKLFDGLQRALREEVLKILLSLTPQEAAKTSIQDDEYDTELTKMAEKATEKGVNEISAGEKNKDKEFKKSTSDKHKSPNSKKNAVKKAKKKQRQNKKKGRR